MGIDAIILLGSQLELADVYGFHDLLNTSSCPALDRLRARCRSYEEEAASGWQLDVGDDSVQSCGVRIAFEGKIACLSGAWRWALVYIWDGELQNLVRDASRELAALMGSDRCIHLADLMAPPMTTISGVEEALETSLGPPVASLRELADGEWNESIDTKYGFIGRWFVDRLSPSVWSS